LVGTLIVVFTASAGAQDKSDWPQWRGPDRDGKSHAQGLLQQWPEGGPKLDWKISTIGRGYSCPVVVGDSMYTMGVIDGQEALLRLDARTGETIWAQQLDEEYENGWGGGPRSTPTIDGTTIYCLTARGKLACITEAGKTVWSKSLTEDFGGEIPRWGYSESVLIDGDRLLVKPGQSSTAVMLDKRTGEKLWATNADELNDEAAYASFIKAKLAGTDTYVTMTGGGLVALAADSGNLLFRYTKTANGIAVIPTPVVSGDFVYSTSGYGTGSALVQAEVANDIFRAEEVYFNKIMKNHHGGVIGLDDAIFGYSDGRGWICQDFKSGEVVWAEDKALGKGSITYADGRFYCYGERDGDCVLIEATRTGWNEQGRFRIPEQTQLPRGSGAIWTHPVIARGKLFLRDQDLLFCYDISGQ
jgi:hypothetical protein